MDEQLWGRRALPARDPGAATIGRWHPSTPADLTTSRLQLSAALQNGSRPPAADQGAVERLLLAFEELVSNALRHGSGPVEAVVTSGGGSWLLEVSDAAADRPPVPAPDRDAALGGLGLPLVAQLCGGHGWTADGDRKVVWARIDPTPQARSDRARGVVPRPRDGGSDRGSG